MYGNIKLPIVAAGLAAALMSISAPVQADPYFSTAKVTVDYAGVDVSTQKGRQQLDSRVNAAINAMCGEAIFGTRDEADALRLCRSEARAAVEPQIQTVFANANQKVASAR